MSKVQIKTDNSNIAEKITLRLQTVNLINKQNVKVIEAYAGDGLIWKKVQKQTDKKITILKIEFKSNKSGLYLKGDNAKFLPSFDLTNFDIIDLDAYGVPYEQLQTIFKKSFTGYIHVTYIQSGMGRLPHKLLEEIGYTHDMVKKCPTLFSKNGLDKMLKYLYKKSIKDVTGYFLQRKNYFYFYVSN